eukprot:COSAG06_NODE_7052_length_2656_cov_1.792726_5_plen_35_part_01
MYNTDTRTHAHTRRDSSVHVQAIDTHTTDDTDTLS